MALFEFVIDFKSSRECHLAPILVAVDYTASDGAQFEKKKFIWMASGMPCSTNVDAQEGVWDSIWESKNEGQLSIALPQFQEQTPT